MGRLTPRLDFDAAWDANPMDARATITLLVVATILSVQRLALGADYDFLMATGRDLPGAWWKFLTTCLLHVNWLHLAFNLYWTYKFGVLLEGLFGTFLLGLIYVGLGLVSSAAQIALDGPGIGLSGIGYGCFGILWALGRWHPKCRGMLDRRIVELFTIWFFICIGLSWLNILPVANVAHGAGFVVGALFGWSLAGEGSHMVKRGSSVFGFALLVTVLLYPPVHGAINSSARTTYLFDRGYDALIREDWEAAREDYEAFVEHESGWPEAWGNLSIAYSRLGRHAEAGRAWQRSQELELARKRAGQDGESSGFQLFEHGED